MLAFAAVGVFVFVVVGLVGLVVAAVEVAIAAQVCTS